MQKKITISLLILTIAMLIGSSTSGGFFTGDINMIDEGQFGAWANHMLHGKLMYRDIYITYGPLYVYPLYILFKLFSPSAFLVRLYLCFGGALGILASYFLMGQLKIKKIIKIVTLSVFMLIPTLHLREATALWTLYFLIKAYNNNTKALYALTGILAAITFLVSQDFGIFIILLSFIHFIYQYLASKNKTVFFSMIFFILGFMIFLLPSFYIFYLEGWLWDYIRVTMDVSISLAGINVPNGQNFPNIISLINTSSLWGFVKSLLSKDILLYYSLTILFGSFFYVVAQLFSRTLRGPRYGIFLITIFGFLVYAVLLTRNGIGHFFYTLPSILIILSFMLNELIGIYKKNKYLSAFLITFILLFLARLLYINNPTIKKILNPVTYLTLNYSNPSRVGDLNISYDQKRRIQTFQQFINKNTKADDYVFFFNDQPMMYMLVNRVNPTNFDLPFAGNTLEKRYQMLNSLISKKPKYIFIDRDVWAVDGIPNTQRLPEVFSYIKQNYSKFYIYNNIIIVYEKK